MKVTSLVTRQVVIEEDSICNRCGESCEIQGNHEGISCWFQSGFGSREFGDGTEHQFDMCERCVKWLYESFKIPAIKEESE